MVFSLVPSSAPAFLLSSPAVTIGRPRARGGGGKTVVPALKVVTGDAHSIRNLAPSGLSAAHFVPGINSEFSRPTSLRLWAKFPEQHLGFLQIRGVKAFGEPKVRGQVRSSLAREWKERHARWGVNIGTVGLLGRWPVVERRWRREGS
jgi:hypothetical protein